MRQGVWVASTIDAWDIKLVSLARALAALEWTPTRGYQSMWDWPVVCTLAQADLLAVTITDEGDAGFPALLRQVNSIVPPTALSVAGVARAVFDRTLVEAGISDLAHAAATPMTLDGVARVDGLVGFDWPTAGQGASLEKSPRE